MRKNTLFTLALLSLAMPGFALERGSTEQGVLSSQPAPVIRLEKKGRKPASVVNREEAEKATLSDLDAKLKVGTHAMVQRSIFGWNDEVVKVVAVYEDGRRKVRRENGEVALVDYKSLHMLSPETESCCNAGAVEICPKDKVFYPTKTVALGVPEGSVERIFENCSVEVRDGISTLFEARQLGKPVDCSPQKDNVCVGKTVLVNGWREGNRYEFEAKVEKVFSEGTVIVKSGADSFPIEAKAAIVQTDALAESDHTNGGRAPASIKLPTIPEVDTFDKNDRVREYDVIEK